MTAIAGICINNVVYIGGDSAGIAGSESRHCPPRPARSIHHAGHGPDETRPRTQPPRAACTRTTRMRATTGTPARPATRAAAERAMPGRR